MEKYYKAQLVAARRAAVSRINARWATDGFDSKTAPAASSTSRTQVPHLMRVDAVERLERRELAHCYYPLIRP